MASIPSSSGNCLHTLTQGTRHCHAPGETQDPVEVCVSLHGYASSEPTLHQTSQAEPYYRQHNVLHSFCRLFHICHSGLSDSWAVNTGPCRGHWALRFRVHIVALAVAILFLCAQRNKYCHAVGLRTFYGSVQLSSGILVHALETVLRDTANL